MVCFMTDDELKAELKAIKDDIADLRRSVAAVSDSSWTGTVHEESRPLYEALTDWRRAEAAEQGIDAYRIFSNRVLAAIATVRPVDSFALLGIKGVGMDKVTRYSDAVLAIVASHAW